MLISHIFMFRLSLPSVNIHIWLIFKNATSNIIQYIISIFHA